MSTPSMRLDANETKFFSRQLEFIKAEVYKTDLPTLKARTLIPVDFSGGNWATSITYRQSKALGRAKVVNNYGDDFPRVGNSREEFTVKVKSLGASYGYSIQDIRAAAKTGMNLKNDEAIAAKESILREENEIAFKGNSDNNLVGFFTEVNVPKAEVAGTGTAKLWINKTPDEIVKDLTTAIGAITTATKGIERADTLLLPSAHFENLASTRLSASLETTIMDWIKTKLMVLGINNIDWLNELTGAGPSGKDMFMLYTRRPDKVVLSIPQDFEQFEEERMKMEYTVACHSRIAGVQFIKPLSAYKGYGI